MQNNTDLSQDLRRISSIVRDTTGSGCLLATPYTAPKLPAINKKTPKLRAYGTTSRSRKQASAAPLNTPLNIPLMPAGTNLSFTPESENMANFIKDRMYPVWGDAEITRGCVRWKQTEHRPTIMMMESDSRSSNYDERNQLLILNTRFDEYALIHLSTAVCSLRAYKWATDSLVALDSTPPSVVHTITHKSYRIVSSIPAGSTRSWNAPRIGKK